MASSKTESAGSRPLSAHRPASTTSPMNVPVRNETPRNHSHSYSLGALNGGHRVARRKSMSNNFAGVAAAVQGMDEASLEALVTPDAQARAIQAAGIHRAGSTSTIRPNTPPHGSAQERQVNSSSAILDDKPAKGRPGPKGNKARRASEGAYLSKSERKRTSGDIRCETCGKGYKHSSCLTKHLWEHTPQWQVTSKLLISKHQQVQMLEAASVLVTMNQDLNVPMVEIAAPVEDSDRSSASPIASGSSAIPDDEISSVETTPPPMIEEEDEEEYMEYTGEGQRMAVKYHNRYSTTSSVFSQSYQSGPSIAGSIPTSNSYGSFHHFGHRRPSTSGTAYSGLGAEDESKLAAAVEGVSFGTPRSSAFQPDADIPPVPPLPARYASHKASLSMGNSAFASFADDLMPTGPRQIISAERGGHQPQLGEDDNITRPSVFRSHSDDHDGVFSMEE